MVFNRTTQVRSLSLSLSLSPALAFYVNNRRYYMMYIDHCIFITLYTHISFFSHINALYMYITYILGQIIATSHDLTPKCSWGREIPLFQENLGWWSIIICPDIYIYMYIYIYLYICTYIYIYMYIRISMAPAFFLGTWILWSLYLTQPTLI